MNKPIQEERFKMDKGKEEVFGGTLIIYGRQITLSKAVRAGGFIF